MSTDPEWTVVSEDEWAEGLNSLGLFTHATEGASDELVHVITRTGTPVGRVVYAEGQGTYHLALENMERCLFDRWAAEQRLSGNPPVAAWQGWWARAQKGRKG